ncbi:hypothetical protein C8Q80DRAFT_1267478 [Daedaleopsis nitida]|nr:hypothetical protein C8Q80DRAFT_1267478 [Daedaleopsis nitida]
MAFEGPRNKTFVRLSHLDKLQLFVALAALNQAIGLAVEDLVISLPVDEGYPAQLLRDCLRLTPNLYMLILTVPTSLPATLLNGIIFHRLKVFSSNLPHCLLPSFLASHSSITSLSLHSCGGRTLCPLRDLGLTRVTDLKCPARCLQGLAHGQVAVATVNLTRMASLAALAINALSTSPIYSLTIDFFSNDFDILARIAYAAPRLRKLKLIEKPRALHRETVGRRPWNDLLAWHRTLMQLMFLEEFMIRTPMTIIGPHRTEEVVVTSWANGTRNHPGQRHPNLYHISILQRGDLVGTQTLSHWFRKKDTWERVSTAQVNATHSFVM